MVLLARSGNSALTQLAMGGGRTPNSFSFPCPRTAQRYLTAHSFDPYFREGNVHPHTLVVTRG